MGRFGLVLLIILVALIFFPLKSEAEERVAPNLIPNPEFENSEGGNGFPFGWHRGSLKIPGVVSSQVFIYSIPGHSGKFLALKGGQDRSGWVWCEISGIRPHTDYLLEFAAYRPRFTNNVYLEVEVFGQHHLINQQYSYGGVQPIFLRINSGSTQGKTRLLIVNHHEEILAFSSPSLQSISIKEGEWEPKSVRLPNFFPIGIFNAVPEDLPEIRSAGFNAVQSYKIGPDTIKKMAAASARQGLKFLLPNFSHYQADITRELGGRPEVLGIYIADEPEGRSLSPKELQTLKESLKQDNPGVLTAVAMLRPQMVAAYREAADVFMIDPYPVPHMPMTWLSDSLEDAARYVPQERLWAVIQAFGGEKWAKHGWPRPPTSAEMRCLTYLAVVHGAHGLFYFSYPEVRADDASWEGLKTIAAELRQLRTWLVAPKAPRTLQLEMTSPFKVDAEGRPAVHFCQKRRAADSLLILVNVIDRPVSFYVHGFGRQVPWLTELFQQHKAVVRDGNIREELGPYEVRIYSYHRED